MQMHSVGMGAAFLELRHLSPSSQVKDQVTAISPVEEFVGAKILNRRWQLAHPSEVELSRTPDPDRVEVARGHLVAHAAACDRRAQPGTLVDIRCVNRRR